MAQCSMGYILGLNHAPHCFISLQVPTCFYVLCSMCTTVYLSLGFFFFFNLASIVVHYSASHASVFPSA